MCAMRVQMALFISTHAEISLLCHLQLLSWKPRTLKKHPLPLQRVTGTISWIKTGRSYQPFALFGSSPAANFTEVPPHLFPLKSPFRKLVYTVSLPDIVKKHSCISLHRKHILLHFKTLPGECAFNPKHTAADFPSRIWLLSAFGGEIHLRRLRGASKLSHSGFEIYTLWLLARQRSRANSLQYKLLDL